MREILATSQFRKDLKTIPNNIIEQADALLFLLKENPVDTALGVKKLVGINPPAWRIRIGVYRLVYTFDKTRLILLRFRHRKDIYRNL